LLNWREQAFDLQHPFVGLILAPNRDDPVYGWLSPEIRGWVAYPHNPSDNAKVVEAKLVFGLERAAA
jgi:hypothetical protein